MGRRDYQSVVAEALPLILKEQVKNNLGSVTFAKKDKKTVGKLYFRAGAIYAIEMSTYSPKIVHRIATNEYISDENREQVLKKFSADPTDTSVIEYVLKYQLFPEKPLVTYLKDYFFDAFDDLYTWTGVSVEWRANEEPPASVPKVPQANPEAAIERLQKRRNYLETVVAPSWNSLYKEIPDLRYCKNLDYVDPLYTNKLLMEMGSGEYTIGFVADYLGLSLFNTEHAIYKLWETGIVDVIHPQGIRYSNRGEEEIHAAQELARTLAEAGEEPTVVIEEEIQIVPTVVESEETQESLGIEEEEPVVIPLSETTTFATEETTEPFAEAESEVVSEARIDTSQIDTELINVIPQTIYEPQPVINTQQANISTDTPIFNNTVTNTSIEEPVTNLTGYTEQDLSNTEKAFASRQQEIKDITSMTDNVSGSGISRLRLIAQQMEAELENLRNQLTDAEANVNQKRANLENLRNERNLFAQKVAECDTKIVIEEASISEAEIVAQQLAADYDESVEFAKKF